MSDPEVRERLTGEIGGGDALGDYALLVYYVTSLQADDDHGPDPGLVGIAIMRPAAGADMAAAGACMTPGDALLLANRLTRAAGFVLEAGEDAPIADHELLRLRQEHDQ